MNPKLKYIKQNIINKSEMLTKKLQTKVLNYFRKFNIK